MKKIFLILSAVLTVSLVGFKSPADSWDAATLEKANTAKDAAGYSDEEKKVVFYMNLARLNPQLFLKTYAQKYIDSAKVKESSFLRSFKNDFTAKYKPMEVLTVKDDLTEEARNHADDTGKKGNLGHNTSDGKSYDFRMKAIKANYTAYAENCDYGNNTALAIVMSLLIDEGSAAVDHRKNIMEKKYLYTGVSIKPHKKEKWTCVMEFGGSEKK